MRCSVKGCGDAGYCRGLCRYHYRREREGLKTEARGHYQKNKGKGCSFPGCPVAAYGRSLCKRHYQTQYMRTYRQRSKKCFYCRTLTGGGAKLCRKHGKWPLHCLICRFKRFVEGAHVISARSGAPRKDWNIVPLCPNHHRLYDNGLMTKQERKKLEPYIEKARARIASRA